MRTYLRHDVHMCLVDEGAIFLDLSANSYLGIDAATSAALTTCLAGLDTGGARQTLTQASEVPAAVATLLKRGILTDSECLGRSFFPLTVAMTDAVPFGVGRARLRIDALHIARFVSALIRVSVTLRRGQILAVVNRLRRGKALISSIPRTQDTQSALILVSIFRRLAAVFYTSKNACLLDSLVLADFLIRYGHRPTLILGVRTKPFFAHAWVQIENCVLNDSIEHAQTLTPIAAI